MKLFNAIILAIAHNDKLIKHLVIFVLLTLCFVPAAERGILLFATGITWASFVPMALKNWIENKQGNLSIKLIALLVLWILAAGFFFIIFRGLLIAFDNVTAGLQSYINSPYFAITLKYVLITICLGVITGLSVAFYMRRSAKLIWLIKTVSFPGALLCVISIIHTFYQTRNIGETLSTHVFSLILLVTGIIVQIACPNPQPNPQRPSFTDIVYLGGFMSFIVSGTIAIVQFIDK